VRNPQTRHFRFVDGPINITLSPGISKRIAIEFNPQEDLVGKDL
jgi:hypothetical protein